MVDMEMPIYKSHKTVHALKIANVQAVDEAGGCKITPADAGYAPFEVDGEWSQRYKGSRDDYGYYVVYDDGYASWSPALAFEAGYTRINPPISDGSMSPR